MKGVGRGNGVSKGSSLWTRELMILLAEMGKPEGVHLKARYLYHPLLYWGLKFIFNWD